MMKLIFIHGVYMQKWGIYKRYWKIYTGIFAFIFVLILSLGIVDEESGGDDAGGCTGGEYDSGNNPKITPTEINRHLTVIHLVLQINPFPIQRITKRKVLLYITRSMRVEVRQQ